MQILLGKYKEVLPARDCLATVLTIQHELLFSTSLNGLHLVLEDISSPLSSCAKAKKNCCQGITGSTFNVFIFTETTQSIIRKYWPPERRIHTEPDIFSFNKTHVWCSVHIEFWMWVMFSVVISMSMIHRLNYASGQPKPLYVLHGYQ